MSNVIVADITNIGVLFMGQKNKLRISNIFIINKAADLLMIFSIFLICLSMNYHTLDIRINFGKAISIFLILICISAAVIYFLKSKVVVFAGDLLLTIRSFIFRIVIFTFAIFAFYIVTAINNAMAFSVDIPVSFLLMVSTLGNLITVLPISLSGIGTRDLSFVVLMNFVNVPSEKALILSSVGYIVIPVISIATIYIVSLIGSKYENSGNC